MKYMNMDIDPKELLTQEQVREILSKNPINNGLMGDISDYESEHFNCELYWHYPLSDSVSVGAYIIPVQEGFLWVPYDDVDKYEGEILLPHDAHLLSAEECEVLADEMQRYMSGLVAALNDMQAHLKSQPQIDT